MLHVHHFDRRVGFAQMQPKREALSESSKLLLRTRRGLVADKGKASVDLTAAERLLVLNLHNKLRGQVSPSAADMKFLVMSTLEEGYCDRIGNSIVVRCNGLVDRFIDRCVGVELNKYSYI